MSKRVRKISKGKTLDHTQGIKVKRVRKAGLGAQRKMKRSITRNIIVTNMIRRGQGTVEVVLQKGDIITEVGGNMTTAQAKVKVDLSQL